MAEYERTELRAENRINRSRERGGEAIMRYRRGEGVGVINAAHRENEAAWQDWYEVTGGLAPGGHDIRKWGQ